MKTPRGRIAEVIAKRFGKADAKTLSDEVAAYLLAEGRVGDLEPLLRDIQQIRAEAGNVEVLARCAHQLDDAIREDIKAEVRKLYPDAKQIIIDEQLDPEVVGGIKIELANEQLDLSVRAKLNKFKQLTATTKGI